MISKSRWPRIRRDGTKKATKKGIDIATETAAGTAPQDTTVLTITTIVAILGQEKASPIGIGSRGTEMRTDIGINDHVTPPITETIATMPINVNIDTNAKRTRYRQ
jgi:hypothetical protein